MSDPLSGSTPDPTPRDESGDGLDYAAQRRAALDAKVRELRADDWDVVARRERDLALLKRDEYRSILEDLIESIAGPVGRVGLRGDPDYSLMRDALQVARRDLHEARS